MLRDLRRESDVIKLVGIVIGIAAAAVMAVPAAEAQPEQETYVVQAGTYDYLAAPDYSGLMPARKVVAGQTLGLGTFDGLTGEFVMVGGNAYLVGIDGTPKKADLGVTTPFLQAVSFVPEKSVPVAPGTTCAQMLDAVNAAVGSNGGLVAVRVRGTFPTLTTRSVPGFSAPYPTLSQAVAQQTTFDLNGRRAVLVGFRTGPDFAGTGAPGLHLHGVTADRAGGGHVLACVAGNDVQLSIQAADGVTILD